jgi:proline dehydrogenase
MGSPEPPIHKLIQRAASAYIAGSTLKDASDVCERLAREGIASTMCYWDAYTDHPQLISEAYVGLLGVISNVPDCYLSVKAPALKFDIEAVKRIIHEARRINAMVHFDALGPDTVDRTFELIAAARGAYGKLSCTLPGRWRRSLRDAARAIELGLRVRVVKGEWPGLDGDETDPREGFLEVIDALAGRASQVAVATHNPTIARHSFRRLTDAGTPCELELLYGLPQQPMLNIARTFGVRTRMYVPYGQAGLPYRLKHAVRNPRIIGWFLHDLLRARK